MINRTEKGQLLKHELDNKAEIDVNQLRSWYGDSGQVVYINIHH